MEEFIMNKIFPVFVVLLLTALTIVLGILIKMLLKDLKNY
jgi:hypothetical protein